MIEHVDLTPERGAFGIKKRDTPNAFYSIMLRTSAECLPGHLYKVRIVVPAHASASKGPAREIVHEDTLDTLKQSWGYVYLGYTPRTNGAHLAVSVQLVDEPPAAAAKSVVATGKRGGEGKSGGKQSREETIAWLRMRLVGQKVTIVAPREENGRAHLPIWGVSLSDDYLVISATGSTLIDPEVRYIINLAKVSPDISLGGTFNNDTGENLILTLTATSQGGLTFEGKDSRVDTPKQVDCPTMYLPFTTDEDLAQRVAKAISHLVHLSGGKKEAF